MTGGGSGEGSGKIVNLRSVRKAKARDAKRQAGAENAVRHGRTKAERAHEQATAERATRHLDGHKRDPDDTP